MQAVTLAALQQLEHSQYLPPEEMRARQLRQLGLLVAHAAKSLPFYRERFFQMRLRSVRTDRRRELGDAADPDARGSTSRRRGAALSKPAEAARRDHDGSHLGIDGRAADRAAFGDRAELGAPCACGRTPPVLVRVLGRTRRNMLVRPDGAQGFPYVGGNAVAEFPAIIQHQVIQQSVTDIEVRLVTRAQLSMEDEALLRGKMLAAIGHPFRIDFVYCDAIERSASGKYVEFRCEVAR